jgi:antitoxin MazE
MRIFRECWNWIMRTRIKKWGNNAAVRIPASIMAGAGLAINQCVHVRGERGQIVIGPVQTQSYDLDALIDALDPSEFPEVADFGPAQGNEAW